MYSSLFFLRQYLQIHRAICLGASFPAEVLVHADGAQGFPFAFVFVEFYRAPNGLEKILSGYAAEHESAGLALHEGRHGAVHDRIHQSAGGMNDGWRTIALTIHLVQTAGFKPRRHDKHIRSSFDLMRKFFIKADYRADLAWVLV